LKAVVVGAGSWGTTFATLLEERGHEVVVAGRRVPYVSVEEAPVAEADLVCLAIPSRAFRDVVQSLPGTAPRLILTKGLDPATGGRLSDVVESAPVAMLSGPNHAEEIAQGLPAAAVLASEDEALATSIQHEVISPRFRVYVNTDLVGVELCAAAKNVMALAAGAVDGLGLGDNAKAALIARGLAEMTRLGEACGARAETFAGLAGMGDLIVTCWSRHSRNRRAGELIARGTAPDDASREIGMVVEGLTTAPVLRDLAHRLGIELPITEGVCAVLGGASLQDLVSGLMGRTPRDE
jgi:glycerol-3-phosphate dehydrogenase (NAD(P)+)